MIRQSAAPRRTRHLLDVGIDRWQARREGHGTPADDRRRAGTGMTPAMPSVRVNTVVNSEMLKIVSAPKPTLSDIERMTGRPWPRTGRAPQDSRHTP
ncbi:hypothetical protein [Streptomyces sp. NBC_00199]|uniref:hypothetical protein n=1 Tax=Streptomyces sp. NBC_00199 TaxID=2975678 RepID=UPI0022590921|nr:hypothetical protein [Streptomyces sp. NBC_00199]MCX5264268.1 hypothetical protein [Streptomyces sp. NBC_00199]